MRAAVIQHTVTRGTRTMVRICSGLALALATLVLSLPAPTQVLAQDAAGATSVAAVSSVTRSVRVGLNKSLVIDLPRDARDILVSNPVIADAVIRTPRRIYVTGVAVGQSNVIIFDRAGQQIVSLELEVERDTSNLTAMMARLIPGSAIDVEMVSDNIVLSGTVRTASDARRAQDIAAVFANGGAQSLGGVSTASGGAQLPASAVVNMLTIEGEDQVHLKVTVAEVRRTIAKQLGISLSGEISIGSFNAGFGTNPGSRAMPEGNNGGGLAGLGFSSGGVSIDAVLRALEQTNMVKTLAEPTLTAISGETASFLAGGEFPVVVASDNNTQTTEFKKYGVQLGFTPVVLSEGRISLKVSTEVSALGPIINDGQSITVRRAESTLELPSGGSLVLGGLIQDNITEVLGAVPGLARLPILGTLFRSREFQREETELVIIVTPYLVTPTSRSALATPDQGFAAPTDAQGIFLGNLNRVYGAGTDGPSSYAAPKMEGNFGFIFE